MITGRDISGDWSWLECHVGTSRVNGHSQDEKGVTSTARRSDLLTVHVQTGAETGAGGLTRRGGVAVRRLTATAGSVRLSAPRPSVTHDDGGDGDGGGGSDPRTDPPPPAPLLQLALRLQV